MPHVLRSPPGASRVLSGSAHAALLRARERVAEAEREAMAILAGARARADAERAAAREEGLARGRAEAGAVLVAAAAARDRLLASAGPELVELALEVARRVLGEEPRATPARIAGLVARALRGARDARAVLVRVCPGDQEWVRSAVPEGTEVVGDPELPEGGCVLETPAGRIDAGLEAQLEELARVMRAQEGT